MGDISWEHRQHQQVMKVIQTGTRCSVGGDSVLVLGLFLCSLCDSFSVSLSPGLFLLCVTLSLFLSHLDMFLLCVTLSLFLSHLDCFFFLRVSLSLFLSFSLSPPDDCTC